MNISKSFSSNWADDVEAEEAELGQRKHRCINNLKLQPLTITILA